MLRFKKDEYPNLDFRLYIKRPIPIKAARVPEEFEVETLEGTMRGKAGDYLVIGVAGEMYPVDKEIFEKTYSPLPCNLTVSEGRE